MSVNDPISDMLTRIRNAGMADSRKRRCHRPKVLVAIAKILKEEGYIVDFRVIEKRPQDQLCSLTPLWRGRKPAIKEIKRVSKPVCGSMPERTTFLEFRAASELP
jgi:small subunit ribosomal protein S8